MTYYSKNKKLSINYVLVIGYSLIAIGFLVLVYLLLSLPSMQQRYPVTSIITGGFPSWLQINKKPPSIRSVITSSQPTTESNNIGAQQNSSDDSISPDGNMTIKPELQISADGFGLAPVYYRINTKQPVVFLGIDDGIVKNVKAVAYMKHNNIKASLFLTLQYIKDKPEYFREIQNLGSVVEDHTIDHKDLTKLSYYDQKKEICGNADAIEILYGRRPTLFRPPYGTFNEETRRAAADCGMKAIIHWHAKANNGSMQYQNGNKLLPGDIILLHFRPLMVEDLTAFNKAAQSAGLHIVLLEDWFQNNPKQTNIRI